MSDPVAAEPLAPPAHVAVPPLPPADPGATSAPPQPLQRREVVFSRSLRWLLAIALLAAIIYALRDVLTPVFLAFAIAYILDPVVDRMEKLRVPRPLGIVVVLGALLASMALFLLLVVPSIVADTAVVARELPGHVRLALSKAEAWLATYGVEAPHSLEEWVDRFGGQLQASASTLVMSASDLLGWIIGGSASILGSFVAALIVPVFAMYLLNDFDRIVAGAHDLIPFRHRDKITSYAREIDLALSQFMRGQVTVMLVLAVLYGGAYSLLGVRLAVAIGILAGILNFIPYLGSTFALVSGLAMSLLGGWQPTQLIGVVIAYSIIQSLEGFVITPRIVGKTVGLSDVWVLLALFVGGEIFGFIGVLLAVPMAAVAKIFVVRTLRHYRASALYGSSGVESP
jgi:predicted PurR-regulated permease PerM